MLALRSPMAWLAIATLAGAAEGFAQTPTATDPRADAISAAFPYASKYVKVMGSSMHYVEQGAGKPILFLHGNPTSSYLWRNVMPHVAASGRAIAVDLIGFGKSDKPPIKYTLQDHAAYVERFIDALDLHDMVLVVHDWGSVIGLDYASRHPERIRGVVFMEAIIPPAFPAENYAALGAGAELFRRFRTPDEGRKLLIDENYFIENILGKGTVTRALRPEELDHYREPFRDPASRYPIYVFPNELPITGKPARNVRVIERIAAWLKTSDTPKLLLYARPGGVVPPEAAMWMRDNYRNIEVEFIGYGRHYIQEDNPEAIGRNIAHWYERQFRAGADTIDTNDFAQALVTATRSPEIRADEDIYAGLLGIWDVEVRDRMEDGSFRKSHGEWHFARTLEGRAVQDVWISPPRGERQSDDTRVGNRYGTSIRTFNPHTRQWQVTWLNPVTGAFDVLLTRKDGGSIIQEGKRADGQPFRWIFTDIAPTTFHWIGESLQADHSWLTEAEFFGKRRGER